MPGELTVAGERARLSVRLSDGASDALRTVMRTGLTKTQATEFALVLLSDAIRGAWDMGLTPVGQMPEIKSVNVTRQDVASDATR